MVAEREPIRLAGRVREVSDPAPGSWRIGVDGKQLQAWRAGWIVVEVEGRDIRVDLEGTTCSGPATAKGKGAWSEVEGEIPLVEDRPAPFKPTTFEAVIPQVGDAVDLYGVVVARGEPEANYREAPPSTVTRARARILARGDNASALLDRAIRDTYPAAMRPSKRDPRLDDQGNPLSRPPLVRWITCLLAVAAAIVAIIWHQRFAAVGFLACAVITRPRRAVRDFRTRDDAAGNMLFDLFALGAWAGLYPILLVFIVVETGRNGESYTEPIWIAAGCLVALAATRELAPYRRLVAATPWTGELGDNVRVEGVVRDPTPVAVGSIDAAAVGREATYDRGVGSDPDRLISKYYHNDNTFFVDAKAGVVEIDPDETVWSSTVVKHGEGSIYDITEVIPIDGKVIAVGSIVAGEPGAPPRLRAKGTRPAVVLGTSSHGDPLGLARAIVHHHYVTLAGLFALTAVSAVLLVSSR